MHRSTVRRSCVAVAGAVALALPLLGGGATGAAPAGGGATPGAPGARDPYFPRYGNGGYDVRHYDLRLRYDPATDRLAGTARVRARAHKRLSAFNLDFVGLRVRSVAVDGRRARWRRPNAHELVVAPRRALRDGGPFSVRVRYAGVPTRHVEPGLGASAFLTTRDGATAIGEPEVAAHWFPVNDHPRDKATYRVRLTVPRRVRAVSNGLPTARRVRGRWATTTWRARDPMASYLAFMTVGRYDVRRWRTAAGLPVVDAVDSALSGPVRRRIGASLARQGRIIAAESEWFGPYPFETAGAVVDRLSAGFALENQTRPIYVPAFWRVPEAPTLGDDVVVHELAHQWYGDSVALRRWRHIWLNEGFATYAEWLWNDRVRGVTPQQFFNEFYVTPRNRPFWRLRIGNPGPDHLFDLPIYIRGAMTLQALRLRIGDDAFFRVLRGWAQGHRNAHGTTVQFVRLAERVSGQSLDRLFRTWLFTRTRPPRPVRAASVPTAGDAGPASQVRRWERGLRARLDLH
jgi:aminopeptidase N